jgi:hypothetical protein
MGRGGSCGVGTRSGRGSICRQVIGGRASGRDGGTPTLEEEEVGFLQLEVSSVSPHAPLISRGGRLLFCFSC